MPGRSYSAGDGYRYGFNGKEMDNEVAGAGNQYDYGFRIYNPRLGRFLSVDPLTASFPWYTPYQFAGNKPIWAIDLDGLEEFVSTNWYNAQDKLYKTTIEFVDDAEVLEGNSIHTIHNYVDQDGFVYFTRSEIEDLQAIDFLDPDVGYANQRGNAEFEVRDDNIDAFSSDPNLYDEWKSETGPENSVMFQTNIMIKDVKSLVGVESNYSAALSKWAQDGQLTPGESYTNGIGEFGLGGAWRVWGEGLFDDDDYIYNTEHFIGSYSFNAWVMDDGETILFSISDSKTRESGTAHIVEGNSHDRGTGRGKGNSYQKYIWTEKIDMTKFNDSKPKK